MYSSSCNLFTSPLPNFSPISISTPVLRIIMVCDTQCRYLETGCYVNNHSLLISNKDGSIRRVLSAVGPSIKHFQFGAERQRESSAPPLDMGEKQNGKRGENLFPSRRIRSASKLRQSLFFYYLKISHQLFQQIKRRKNMNRCVRTK